MLVLWNNDWCYNNNEDIVYEKVYFHNILNCGNDSMIDKFA